MATTKKKASSKNKSTKCRVLKQNLGIDIAKADFKASLQFEYEDERIVVINRRTFKNTLAGFRAMLKWLKSKICSHIPLHVTMEATGVYYEHLAYYLNAKTDFLVSVILPNIGRAYMKSLNLKSKTDKIDADALGKMGLERKLELWEPITPIMRHLKQLCRYRVSLIEQKTTLKNQLHAQEHSYEPCKQAIKGNKVITKAIEKQIKIAEQEILQTIKEDTELDQKIDNVCQLKGLGIITVATVVAELNGFVFFTSRGQVINFCGYDIIQNESGSSIKGKTCISKKGNRFVRRALHFPAITAVKYDPRFTKTFDKVFDKTNIKMMGYVAVQRKLLLIIYALFTKNVPYQENYLQNQAQQNNIVVEQN